MKGIWSLIGVLALAGLCMMGVGYALGGGTGISIGKNGLTTDAGNVHELVSQKNIDAITEIKIAVSSADVRIIDSNYYGFEIYGTENSNFSYSFKDGRLTIDHNPGNSITIMGIWIEDDYINIYMPKDAVLSYTDIKNTSGRVEIDSLQSMSFNLKMSSGRAEIKNITADNMNMTCTSGNISLGEVYGDSAIFKLSSGDIDINHIEADQIDIGNTSGKITLGKVRCTGLNATTSSGKISVKNADAAEIYAKSTSGDIIVEGGRADSYDFVLSSGRLDVSGVESKGFNAKITSGNAAISGVLSGVNKINSSSGRVDMDIDGAEADFSRNVSSSSGSIRVNDEKDTGHYERSGAPNSLDVKTTSGNIKINFSR